MKALVVDDSDACRRALADLVAAAGFDVAGTAASGEEACREVERLRPDLVLLDVRMPGMDGYETARAIEASGSGAVVVLTSASSLPLGAPSDYVVSKSALTPALLRELWRIRAPAA